MWNGVAELLAEEFSLYAIDRRGQGASSAPDDAYDFTDFADDTVAVIDHLQLRDAYAVGHSAGGTDVLLAAAARPDAFARIWVMEPTVMDPSEPDVRADMAPMHAQTLSVFAHRRAVFGSRDEVRDRYDGRGVFTGWCDDILDAFVHDGFADEPDGSVSLRCTPAHEVSMLRRIFAAMEGTYRGDGATNPFDALRQVPCPVLVLTTESSPPIYRQMAEALHGMVADTTAEHLDGLGHAAPQVDPTRVAESILRFWHTTRRSTQ